VADYSRRNGKMVNEEARCWESAPTVRGCFVKASRDRPSNRYDHAASRNDSLGPFLTRACAQPGIVSHRHVGAAEAMKGVIVRSRLVSSDPNRSAMGRD